MSIHNICFRWEIRKISAVFGWKKCLICCYGLGFETHSKPSYMLSTAVGYNWQRYNFRSLIHRWFQYFKFSDCYLIFIPDQLDTCLTGDQEVVGFTPAWLATFFVEIDHEMFRTVILSLLLIQEEQLSVSVERICTILTSLRTKPAQ